jgi:hypothetical protein
MRDDDVKTRRDVDDDENYNDNESMKNAEIDRGDDSMNDLSEIDRRDLFRM